MRANTAPTPVINSAAMRAGTTLLDVSFRVNDPDDATVKVRALAFIDGTRSFAKVIKPVTFVEGTASNLGDAIATNTNLTLTWDVGADWATDVGQLKFEVLALDQRGLVAFDWITIPAAGGQPALTISKDTPAGAKVLDALFWEYAGSNPCVTLDSGVLKGNSLSGIFSGVPLASGATPQPFSPVFLFKRMNLDPATAAEVDYAATTARAGLLSTTSWHAANRSYAGASLVFGWGNTGNGAITIPTGLTKVVAVSSGNYHVLALRGDGSVVAWGNNSVGQATVPAGLSGVIAIAAGGYFSLALKSDGTVVGWGQIAMPTGLTGVVAIAAGYGHALALKGDGTVVGWGSNSYGETTIPTGLSGVTALAGGYSHSLALKSDGTVVAWGQNNNGQVSVPAGLSGVTRIAAGAYHNLVLKSDGSLVAWGANWYGQGAIPAGLSGVTKIASHSTAHCNLVLKSDGTVVAWGYTGSGQTVVPAGLSGVAAFAVGGDHCVVILSEVP